LDEETEEPIQGMLQIIDIRTKKVIKEIKNEANGDYEVKLSKGGQYIVVVKKENYMPFEEKVNIPLDFKGNEIQANLYLKKIKEGQRVVLEDINFEVNSAKLTSASYSYLDRFVDFLKDNPKVKLEISGHTDNTGLESYNQKLSERRAKAVVDYLVSKEISEDGLTAKGYGSKQPIESNETEEGRAKNRRVEIKVLE